MVDIKLALAYYHRMDKISKAASALGKRSFEVRREKWGEKGYARRMSEWGELGGRPLKQWDKLSASGKRARRLRKRQQKAFEAKGE